MNRAFLRLVMLQLCWTWMTVFLQNRAPYFGCLIILKEEWSIPLSLTVLKMRGVIPNSHQSFNSSIDCFFLCGLKIAISFWLGWLYFGRESKQLLEGHNIGLVQGLSVNLGLHLVYKRSMPLRWLTGRSIFPHKCCHSCASSLVSCFASKAFSSLSHPLFYDHLYINF